MYILKRRNVERRVDTQEAADKLKAQGFTLLEPEAASEVELPADQQQRDPPVPPVEKPKGGRTGKNTGKGDAPATPGQEGAGGDDQPGADQTDGAGAAGQPGA